MNDNSVGQSVVRLEDDRLLTGRGTFSGNLRFEGELFAAFVRSPHAHADIILFDLGDACQMPGVVAIYTGEDTAHLGAIPTINPVTSSDGSAMIEPPRPVLAKDRVRYVGESVAMVVAQTAALAREAADAVFVEYAERPAAIGEYAALEPDAPLVWDEAPGNLCYDWSAGNGDDVDAAFAAADHRSELSFLGNKIHYAAVETRVAIATPAGGGITLYCPSQGAHLLQMLIAERVFAKPKDWLRVVTGDVGGGFGPKFFAYPEHAAVVFAAGTLDCPVRWESGRDEAFLSDVQSRAQSAKVELALDAAGKFTAFRISAVGDLGAYLSTFGPGILTTGMARVVSGSYAIPAIHLRVRGAFTNTVPVDAFRGSGSVDPATMLERIVDIAAAETGRDPMKLRRLNLLPESAMPHTTPVGMVYDSGNYEAVFDAALKKADWAGFPARRTASEAAGRRRGIGISLYVHGTGGIADEQAVVEVDPGGFVTALAGGQSGGQGHETIFAQLVADEFGVPYGDVRVVEGDTAVIPRGGGTGGSSSTVISGATLSRAAERAAEKGRELAAYVLEAAVADIELKRGEYRITGTDRAIGLYELAARASELEDLPADLQGGIEGQSRFEDQKGTFPQGCIICEVEVDPDTGEIIVERITSALDAGSMINPALVAGQMHGGIVQGISQTLWEECVHAPDSGQLLTGSWMDYVVPRAEDLPEIDHVSLESPSPNNRLGAKGVGELGSIGAPAAAANAVFNALGMSASPKLSLPLTSEKIWRLLQSKTV